MDGIDALMGPRLADALRARNRLSATYSTPRSRRVLFAGPTDDAAEVGPDATDLWSLSVRGLAPDDIAALQTFPALLSMASADPAVVDVLLKRVSAKTRELLLWGEAHPNSAKLLKKCAKTLHTLVLAGRHLDAIDQVRGARKVHLHGATAAQVAAGLRIPNLTHLCLHGCEVPGDLLALRPPEVQVFGERLCLSKTLWMVPASMRTALPPEMPAGLVALGFFGPGSLDLAGLPPWDVQQLRLEHLTLEHTEALAERSLRGLRLYRCDVGGADLAILDECTSLTSIDLTGTSSARSPANGWRSAPRPGVGMPVEMEDYQLILDSGLERDDILRRWCTTLARSLEVLTAFHPWDPGLVDGLRAARTNTYWTQILLDVRAAIVRHGSRYKQATPYRQAYTDAVEGLMRAFQESVVATAHDVVVSQPWALVQLGELTALFHYAAQVWNDADDPPSLPFDLDASVLYETMIRFDYRVPPDCPPEPDVGQRWRAL